MTISSFSERSSRGGATEATEFKWLDLPECRNLCWTGQKELVEELVDSDITATVRDLTAPKKKDSIVYDQVDMEQMSLFDTVQDDDIIQEIRELDVSNLTPMDALNFLYRMQNKIKNRW